MLLIEGDEMERMRQMQMQSPMAQMNPAKEFAKQKESLQLLKYDSVMDDVETRLLSKHNIQ